MQNDQPFMAFASCKLVAGASRSAIYDLHTNKIHLIPSILQEILEAYNGKTIQDVIDAYGAEYSAIIGEYFEFLEREEIIFYTTMPDSFPQLSEDWFAHSVIRDCIIDLGTDNIAHFAAIVESLCELDCLTLEIRAYGPYGIHVFEELMQQLEVATVTSVTLIAKYNPDIAAAAWSNLCDCFPRITSLTIHSCENDESGASIRYFTPMNFTSRHIENETACGKINQEQFLSYTDLFTEAKQHNTCLNCKVGIDQNGYIRNCPSMPEHFGHISSTNITEATGQAGFKKLWNIGKDHINVCKNCEFRYACTDCRAYLDDPADIFSKPLKCGYNPYTCEWEEWSTHPLKQRSIQYYNI